MSTLLELAQQGLFKFSYNDLVCQSISTEPTTWEDFENLCGTYTWETLECGSLSAKTYEQLDCSSRLGVLAWSYFTCENAERYVKPVLYFDDTIYLNDECS